MHFKEEFIMMETRARECNRLIDKMMDIFNEYGALNAISEMDEQSIKFIKLSIDLVHESQKLLLEQAKMMDDQNSKMDEMLEILRTKEKES